MLEKDDKRKEEARKQKGKKEQKEQKEAADWRRRNGYPVQVERKPDPIDDSVPNRHEEGMLRQ